MKILTATGEENLARTKSSAAFRHLTINELRAFARIVRTIRQNMIVEMRATKNENRHFTLYTELWFVEDSAETVADQKEYLKNTNDWPLAGVVRDMLDRGEAVVV